MNNPTFWWHVAEVAGILLIIGLFTFGIVKPTNRTVYTQPVTQNHSFENLKVGFGGCARFPVVKENNK